MFELWAQQIREWSLEKADIRLTDKQVAQFCLYGNLLLEWNQKMNLTSIVDPREVILKHFVDSLTINQYIRGLKMADIGTGAGFPGIPLKIVQPSLQVVLIDSLNKRLDFLREIVIKLDLSRVEILHARVEELGRNEKYRAGFDIVTSRAVARLPVLLEYAIPLLRVNGIFIVMKGSQVDDELIEAKRALVELGARIDSVEKFSLGTEAEYRSIVIVRKIVITSKDYPRKPGIPNKNPLV
ncbi:MAG: 16S rRNA (guanine(527)-N(7))-methyltransferase RsmG [Desulfitobacteriaceae bacterium]